MIKALLFDFYGTLVEEDDVYIKQICNEIYEKSPKTCSNSEIGKYWYQRFLNLCNGSFGDGFMLQREIEVQALQSTIQYFQSEADAIALSEMLFSYWSAPQAFGNTAQMLSQLSLKTCVVSNIDDLDLNAALNHIAFTPDFMVTSESAKSYKPRAEMFQQALERLKLKPSEVIHIGDSYSNDIVGSNKLGIANIWMNNKKRINRGRIKPDHEVADILEILPIIANR